MRFLLFLLRDFWIVGSAAGARVCPAGELLFGGGVAKRIGRTRVRQIERCCLRKEGGGEEYIRCPKQCLAKMGGSCQTDGEGLRALCDHHSLSFSANEKHGPAARAAPLRRRRRQRQRAAVEGTDALKLRQARSKNGWRGGSRACASSGLPPRTAPDCMNAVHQIYFLPLTTPQARSNGAPT